MAKSIEKTTQVASVSAKKLKNISLDVFERRQEKLSISYRDAVLSENARIKATMTTFSFSRNVIIQYFHSMDSHILEKAGLPKEQVSVLMQYRQQCLSVLGRLTPDNFLKLGVRAKNGKTSIFYILQYLYKYCKEYEIKKTKQENKK